MGFRVLVADDEADLRDTLVRVLGRLGYSCLTASSGAEAMQVIQAESPDLVVTDLHMPGIDGVAVARYAREHSPPIPVVLMTAYRMRGSHREAQEAGATIHLSKPFANLDLVRAVERALGGGIDFLYADRSASGSRRPDRNG
jgi:CheY-like chemotaxis protein